MNRIRTAGLLLAAAAVLGSAGIVACDDSQTAMCGDGQTVCDEQGNPLIYAPYIVPAFGVFGQPGYIPIATYYPGSPQYHVTYVNHPPSYKPPVAPKPPPANPSNAKPTAPVKAPAPPGYKAPSVKVNAPSVKAPSVGINRPPAPAPKAPAPAPKSGK